VRTVQPFLNRYCLECHGPRQQKGNRHFDQLNSEIRDDDAHTTFQEILDQLTLGSMPPKKAQQPPQEERRAVIAWFTDRIALDRATRRSAAAGPLLRRLNLREYRNTLRDLLALDMTIFDPTAGLPKDQLEDHFDNIGAALVTSGPLLDRYLDAAEHAIRKAIYPLDRPQPQVWTFRGPFYQQREIDGSRERAKALNYLGLYDVVGSEKNEGAYAPMLDFPEGVPADGTYELRFRAAGVNRINHYDQAFLGLDPAEPLRLGIVPGNAAVGPMHKPQPIEPLLAELELADEAQWYTVPIRLDRGFSPRFTFRNGPIDVQSFWQKLVAKYRDEFKKLKLRADGAVTRVVARTAVLSNGKLPQIRIHEVEIKGPVINEWPTTSQQAVFGEDCARIISSRTIDEPQVRRQLTRFATRAFRRPAQPEEIDRLVTLWQDGCRSGRTPLEAYADALQAVLVSPGFLYFDEHADDGSSSAFALASRLSYFLWSTMPDQRLLDLAADGRLRDPKVLAGEAERMLRDSRVEGFIHSFLDSWLTLRDLGSMPPDRKNFKAYYQNDLGPAMRRETELFAQALLSENLSVMNFLDADFTFVNRPLARHYWLEPPEGFGFERVKLTDKRRGGLLGQAGVLAVTANGIETSPVVRGVWLLENILGTPPSPPLADVEPLDPDARGATSIRERLQKHRENPNCYECHRKIDPLGFALENFDPIGRWRDHDEQGLKIDSAGELPDGATFADVIGLKRILVEQRELFARSLARKLLEYALGRRLKPTDRPAIDRLLAHQRQAGNGFRDLVIQAVLSEPFCTPVVKSVSP